MRLRDLGEFRLIERIRRANPKGRGVLLGIGDDAAWVKNLTGTSLITADLLIEKIHFNLRWITLLDLGYKTAAVNLSDIAAMGGVPAYLILSLGIPASFDSNKIDALYRGLRSLCVPSGVALVGGDISAAPSLIISACVVGHAPYRPVTRAGAKEGDDIYVTGTLGDAALALELLERKGHHPTGSHFEYLLARHHRPTPRLRAGALLARERLAAAMIDVSDGLVQDLGHICQASGTGALIRAADLPRSRAYRALAGSDENRYALSGGEDYELLFCARPKVRAGIERIQKRARVAITRIGSCVPARNGITVLGGSGKPIELDVGGYDHFRKS
jgi:thiamine-monophosphate kinase